ncbi:MAG: diacylglycerol kinase family protein [Coriobacteriales bacterium]|jgi:undecaprenol kinase
MTNDAGGGKPDISKNRSIKSLGKAMRLAIAGIVKTFKTERNMAIFVVVAIIALVLCAVLRCTPVEWCIVIIMIALVFTTELINTAIESAVDLTTSEFHPKAKDAKDIAAGAVFFISMASAVVGIIVYITAFLRLI